MSSVDPILSALRRIERAYIKHRDEPGVDTLWAFKNAVDSLTSRSKHITNGGENRGTTPKEDEMKK